MDRGERQLIIRFCAEAKEWRRDLGITQVRLGHLVEMSPSWIAMMEQGAVLPDPPMRHKIRLALEDQEIKRDARCANRKGAGVFGSESVER